MSLPVSNSSRKRVRDPAAPSSLAPAAASAAIDSAFQPPASQRMRTRSQTCQPPSASSATAAHREQLSAQGSFSSVSAPPAYLRLYRHALESIFAFCTLSELHRLSTVCRAWNIAVHSTPCIRASIAELPLIDDVAGSVALLEASSLAPHTESLSSLLNRGVAR
jgi:hypothetical protein